MKYYIYQAVTGCVFYICLPFLLLYVLLTGRQREDLGERFGFYPAGQLPAGGGPLVWLHAASVGEVQAAKAVEEVIRERMPAARIICTSLTLHGKRAARRNLDEKTCCLLAPLDAPFIVQHAVRRIRPDIYLCLETELWPLLIMYLQKRAVPVAILNGRISDKSYNSYLRLRFLLQPMLAKMAALAVIAGKDRDRYVALGAEEGAVALFGNVKYDLPAPENGDVTRKQYRQLLGADDNRKILVAGSTHTGEEDILLDLFCRESASLEVLFVLAPRHIERVAEIEELLRQRGLRWRRFSEQGESAPALQNEDGRGAIILVDVIGELVNLYGASDIVFIGGSLINRGGHNMLEAAMWGRPVLFGPSVSNFQDPAELLQAAGGAFQVRSGDELAEKIQLLLEDDEAYRQASHAARETAESLRGAGRRQVDFVLQKIREESGVSFFSQG